MPGGRGQGGDRRRRPAAAERAHAGEQLGRGERLDEVVVGAGVETRDPVLDGVAGGEQQDRGADPLRAQPAADGESVEAGHGDVEHDDVGDRALDGGERRAAVRGGDGLVALGRERPDEHPEDGWVVVDDQDAFRHADEM